MDPMDNAVALVESYLRVNGYFTVTEYPVVELARNGGCRTATDLDILAFRFPGAGRAVPASQAGLQGEPETALFAPDPELGCSAEQADMLIGEVKEGRAELNRGARDPAVLRAVLTRFGCCHPSHVPEVVKSLLRDGCAKTHCGHTVRLVAFGSLPAYAENPRCRVITLGHVEGFLRDYMREHWDVLRHAQFKEPAFGFLLMLEKARAGQQEQEQ